MKKIYSDLVARVPEYKEFHTVDKLDTNSKNLAEKFPNIVELFELGKSRDNHSIYCLKIGNGRNNGLMFGCPHPNEPVGTMMLEYFTEELAKNKQLRETLDYTWYIVKCWDVDGTKLNEKWFKGPFTLYNYSRNFFRPASNQQVDWTFPIDYKNLHFHDILPETKAMMTLIDQIKPIFIYSLHNSGFGGAYWYITDEAEEVYDDLRNAAIKQGVPLSLGEAESPECEAYDRAIYKNLGLKAIYDHMEKYGETHPEKYIKNGTMSSDYAKTHYNSFTLLTEIPYFSSKDTSDLSESAITRKDVVLKKIAANTVIDSFINKTLANIDSYIREDNPFKLALDSFIGDDNSNKILRKMIEDNPDFLRKATESERFDNLFISKFYKMLSVGLLVRAIEVELEKIKNTEEINTAKAKSLKSNFNSSLDKLKKLNGELEKNIDYKVVPIKKLVSIQLECGLIMAEFLKNIKN